MTVSLERLRVLRDAVAELTIKEPVYMPIFLRLDREVAMAEASESMSAVDRARAMHQMMKEAA